MEEWRELKMKSREERERKRGEAGVGSR